MPIHFLPNDPLADGGPRVRVKEPRPDPPAGRARFALPNGGAPALHPVGSPGFLFWQCREAALATLEAWETIDRPLARWQLGPGPLPLTHDAGPGLNASYDRSALAFRSWAGAGKHTHVGASTDAVAHEVGHALLDAVRPELWGSFYPECAAFHEAFADCISLLVGLFDRDCRAALVAAGLRQPNFVEALTEDVADGIRREHGVAHPNASPRRALNAFQWQIPINLAAHGPPELLTSEPHSFGRVFTGCFYDLVVRLFEAAPAQGEQELLAAATNAGRLLVAGARGAPEGARFFQAVGRGMVLADEQAGGENHLAIRDAFAAHGVALGSTVALAPTAGLGVPAPRVDAAGHVSLSPEGRRRLRRRLRAGPRSNLQMKASNVGGRPVARAEHRRWVTLRGPGLSAVVAPAIESVLLGASGAGAAILGQLQEAETTIDEVRHFARSLVEAGVAALPSRRQPAAEDLPTHTLRTRGGKKVLERVRFACRPPLPVR